MISTGKQAEKRVLVIAMYSHVEAYPPSLNAIFQLATTYEKIFVLVRNVLKSKWAYPQNVELLPVGNFQTFEQVMKNPTFSKVYSYLTFGLALRKLIKGQLPSAVLLYDTPAFSLFNLFSYSLKRKKLLIWYHNHDVVSEAELPRFSILRILRKLEIFYFPRIDYFSLPNYKRLPYFPVATLKRNAFIIPNYPSKYFFGKYRNDGRVDNTAKLIFQGHINPSNFLEPFVEALGQRDSEFSLELHLVGPINADYKLKLEQLAQRLSVGNRLFFYGKLPYSELPKITAGCHIGLATYGSQNIMVRTMSTASNKLFEYGSVGLPVIMTKTKEVVEEFSAFEWIHFCEMERASIAKTLNEIILNYSKYSAKAVSDFETTLNYEIAFKPVLESINETL